MIAVPSLLRLMRFSVALVLLASLVSCGGAIRPRPVPCASPIECAKFTTARVPECGVVGPVQNELQQVANRHPTRTITVTVRQRLTEANTDNPEHDRFLTREIPATKVEDLACIRSFRPLSDVILVSSFTIVSACWTGACSTSIEPTPNPGKVTRRTEASCEQACSAPGGACERVLLDPGNPFHKPTADALGDLARRVLTTSAPGRVDASPLFALLGAPMSTDCARKPLDLLANDRFRWHGESCSFDARFQPPIGVNAAIYLPPSLTGQVGSGANSRTLTFSPPEHAVAIRYEDAAGAELGGEILQSVAVQSTSMLLSGSHSLCMLVTFPGGGSSSGVR